MSQADDTQETSKNRTWKIPLTPSSEKTSAENPVRRFMTNMMGEDQVKKIEDATELARRRSELIAKCRTVRTVAGTAFVVFVCIVLSLVFLRFAWLLWHASEFA